MKNYLLTMLIVAFAFNAGAKKYPFVVLETTMGSIKIKLHEDTPLHNDNLLKLIAAKHYDGLLFHRVIKDFMIQGGSGDSKNAEKGKMLGMGDSNTRIPAEIRAAHMHMKGALAAARQGDQVNPERESSGEQFYIVQGKTYTDEELDMIEMNRLNKVKHTFGRELFKSHEDEFKTYSVKGDKVKVDSLLNTIQQEVDKHFENNDSFRIPQNHREIYKTIGGTPFLDGEYTVYGQVTEGLEVVEKIAEQPIDRNNRPLEDIKIIRAYTSKK